MHDLLKMLMWENSLQIYLDQIIQPAFAKLFLYTRHPFKQMQKLWSKSIKAFYHIPKFLADFNYVSKVGSLNMRCTLYFFHLTTHSFYDEIKVVSQRLIDFRGEEEYLIHRS